MLLFLTGMLLGIPFGYLVKIYDKNKKIEILEDEISRLGGDLFIAERELTILRSRLEMIEPIKIKGGEE